MKDRLSCPQCEVDMLQINLPDDRCAQVLAPGNPNHGMDWHLTRIDFWFCRVCSSIKGEAYLDLPKDQKPVQVIASGHRPEDV